MEDRAPAPLHTLDSVETRGASAHPLRRIVAYLIDALFVGLMIYLGVAIMGLVLGPTIRFESAGDLTVVTVDEVRVALNAVFGTMLSGGYFVGSWVRVGRTPGQALIRIRVVGVRDGEPLTVAAAIVRWIALGAPIGLLGVLVRPIPGAGLWLTLAAAVWIVILLLTTVASRAHRGVHDRWAGSVVVHVRHGQVQRARPTPPAPMA